MDNGIIVTVRGCKPHNPRNSDKSWLGRVASDKEYYYEYRIYKDGRKILRQKYL